MSPSDEGRFVYAARRTAECDHIVGVWSDAVESRKDAAKGVAQWIRKGYIVERLPLEDIRSGAAKLERRCAACEGVQP